MTVTDGTVYRVLICDRDAKWSELVRARLQDGGLRVIQTPYRAPNANAHAERFVRSIKEECLNRLIPFGERHFRRAIAECVTQYHCERNHQGLGNELVELAQEQTRGGRIRRPFTTRRAAQLLRKGGVTEPSSRFSGLARDTTVRSLSPPSRRSWTLLRLRSQRGEIGRRGGRGGGVSAHVAAAHVSTWRQKS